MATSLVPLFLLARQSGTASAAGETAAYVEGAAREAGETPPRWIRFLYWRYRCIVLLLQVADASAGCRCQYSFIGLHAW